MDLLGPASKAGAKRRGPHAYVHALAMTPRGSSGGAGAAGARVAAEAAAAVAARAAGLARHPATGAVVYMALGGFLAYLLLAFVGSRALAPPLEPPVPGMNGPTAAAAAAAAAMHAAAAARAAELLALDAGRPVTCDNSCFKANDGVCDDGRHYPNMTQGLETWVVCDLGTDCADCGPWKGAPHTASWTEPVGPIEFLRRRGIEVRSRTTAYRPKFTFAYTNPAHDVDVSASASATGVVEASISHIFYHVLHGPCSVTGRGLFVDVGANFGWYSLLAGAMGCSVIAFEPVPQFRAFFEYNVARNGLAHKIQIRPAAAVAHPGRGNYTVVVPQRGIWGTAGIDGANIDHLIDNEGEYERVRVSGESLDQVLADRHVDLLKVDVEGFEPDVIQGASSLLSRQLIDNVVMEYSPHVAEKASRWEELSRPPRMLLSLIEGPSAFTIGHIQHRGGEVEIASWSQPLGLYAQVTAANLQHDLLDAKLVSKTGMIWAREPCPAMVNLALLVDGMPERFHPKSFRSVINFNTNVWASRLERFLPHLRGAPVGVIPLGASLREGWFPPPNWTELGSGGRSCAELRATAARERLDDAGRASLLVSHHCRCGEEAPCPEAEAIADGCARRGEIPFED
ncbi:hypothetical protein Rsub_12839 [Raphidocelis subcapitata]|uniref:Methyltransferase FkbM domain-containing protein n=1 Tax=Raphidocelis subcapitata TaxID=307507 RepID=A0A2V0PRF2_9CHLO|nr:hypothetical protein Rsub_12839 [Raphidocelis subcapitata]|eukprot:GBG00148.1 hypothetical protein Rsub_12839 [Raphidocelis subcapitata]